MQKIKRLIKEGWWAIVAIRNFPVYFVARLGLYKDKKIILRLRNGFNYVVRTNTGEPQLMEEIWHRNVYNRFFSMIHDGATVIDIGANIGIFSVKAARQGINVRVLSYEPVPGNFAVLQENLTLNHVASRVVAHQQAVAGNPGEFELYYEEHDTGSGSFTPHHAAETKAIKIQAVTLADIFKKERIVQCDFLKMDCEGAEEDILFNVPEDIFPKIKSMTIEWHDNLSKHGFENFKLFLESKGYKTEFDTRTASLYAKRA